MSGKNCLGLEALESGVGLTGFEHRKAFVAIRAGRNETALFLIE